MAQKQVGNWAELLEEMSPICALTSEGDPVLLQKMRSAEDFIVTCLVAQFLACRAGKASKETLSIDGIVSAGGLAYRPAKQTIYNATSSLAKSQIITKAGNEFRVGERIVVQFFKTKLPELLGLVAAKTSGGEL